MERLPPTVGSLGLSPRVRGNRELSRCLKLVQGSIPARAGEPLVIKSLNFLEFFTMSKSTERFWSPLFAFYKQNPVSVHDLLRGFAEGFYAEISDRFRITPNQDDRPRAKRLPPR